MRNLPGTIPGRYELELVSDELRHSDVIMTSFYPSDDFLIKFIIGSDFSNLILFDTK